MAGCLQQLLPKSRTGYWRIFVKTRIQSLSFLATLALAMICWGSALQAQNTPSTTPDRQAQQPSSSQDTTPPQSTPETQAPSSQSPSSQTPDSSQSPDTTAPPPSSRTPDSGAQQSGSADSGAASGTQTFSGTVAKQGDKYVLKDDSGHTYDIDHQDEVKKFDGKRVRVQGTLDPSTNKIMVK
jgi:cytoskeletal protein RodZ